MQYEVDERVKEAGVLPAAINDALEKVGTHVSPRKKANRIPTASEWQLAGSNINRPEFPESVRQNLRNPEPAS